MGSKLQGMLTEGQFLPLRNSASPPAGYRMVSARGFCQIINSNLHNSNEINHKDCRPAHVAIINSNYGRLVYCLFCSVERRMSFVLPAGTQTKRMLIHELKIVARS